MANANDSAAGKTVHVDFNKTTPKIATPFKVAGKSDRRLKLLEWGDTGTHKTIMALGFPSPVVIDLEKGTELYGSAFKFDVIDPPPSTADEVIAAVEWLATNKHNYKTLVIDPITIFWELLQKKWSDIFLKRNRSGKGFKHEFYDLQIRDWQTIKSEWKGFLQGLIRLDMNVIVTARQKVQYADGEMMKKVGETFDGEKSLPYIFDTILHMKKHDGKYVATCMKDRSGHFKEGQEIENPSYETFESLFGKTPLNRKAKPQDNTPQTPDMAPSTSPAPSVPPAPQEVPVSVTAGTAVEDHRAKVNSHISELIVELKLSDTEVARSLAKRGVKNITELSDDVAESIESHLDAMVVFAKAKEEKNPSA